MSFSIPPLCRNSSQSLVGCVAQSDALRPVQTLWSRTLRIRFGRLTRQLFCFLCGVGFVTSALGADPSMWWRFDVMMDARTPERTAPSGDLVTGNFKLVPGIAGHALKFDGFTTELVRPAASVPRLPDNFTIEAWVALGAYPINWCPLIEQRNGTNAGYSIALGPRGELRLSLASGGQWRECVSKDFILPLRQWSQVAATFEPGRGLMIYVDGQPAGHTDVGGAITPAPNSDLHLGAIPAPTKPSNLYREHGTLPGWFSLDGIVDELKVHAYALSAEEIQSSFAAVKPAAAPEFAARKMPSGPPGPGRFGAYYTQLKFYDEWDALWRVGSDPDVLVRFDESPVRVVFWRGTRYSPAWVSENDKWMADQSVEAWGEGTNDVEGCFEHMQDPKCLYSQVRIIENTDARVVVHWRYAPVSAHNHLWRVDPKTGYACWVDEYYTIYPDAVGVRKVTWQRGTLGDVRQFQESLPLTHPGQYPSNVVQRDFCTVANLKGETATMSFVANPKKEKTNLPPDLCMQTYNFKAQNSPFIIYEPGTHMEDVVDQDERHYAQPGPCNHWPVGQAACDGRHSQAADQPTHFLGFPISYSPVYTNDTREWWNGLYGMSTKPITQLTGLARSWSQAPELVLKGKEFSSAGFDRGDRAYQLARAAAADSGALECEIKASADSPLVNVALVVKNWGTAGANLQINGQPVPRGSKFRYGHRHELDGSTLLVFIQREATSPITIQLTPEHL